MDIRVNSEVDAPVDGDIDETDETAAPFDGRGVESNGEESEVEKGGERAGLYLAVLAALAVPALIVLALFLPSSPVGGALGTTDTETPSTGLDTVEFEDVPVEVAGAGVSNDTEDSSDAEEVSTEIGLPASLEADDSGSEPDDAVVVILDAPASDDETGDPAPQVTDPDDSTDTNASETSTDATDETATVPTTTSASPSPAPQTTAATDVSPTETPQTTVVTSTTQTPTTTAPQPETEPAEFGQRVEIGRIGEATLQFRFSSQTTTAYVVTIRSGATTVTSSSGEARANQLVNETVQGLTPGTDYTVQVTLSGPPVATSPRVAFRTSGGDNVASPTENVSVQNLRLAEAGSTRFEVRYESNICANGSFVIREQGGPVVGSNSGQASGCTTRHLGIPGFWTAALKPSTTYVITVQVEANGAGKGAGNTATQSLVVTTSA